MPTDMPATINVKGANDIQPTLQLYLSACQNQQVSRLINSHEVVPSNGLENFSHLSGTDVLQRHNNVAVALRRGGFETRDR